MNKQSPRLGSTLVTLPQPKHAAPGKIRITTVVAIAGVVLFSAAACVTMNPGLFRGLFGPPVVAMTESYGLRSDGPTFDHTTFDAVLNKYVSPEGWVNYAGLKHDTTQLDGYIASLAGAAIEKMARNERLALLINAYNAFTLRLILDHYPIKSIKDIPSEQRWDDRRWQIGSLQLSLNSIEHEQVRPHFKEPRIHFALVCAAVGCPPLSNTAYRADQLEAQLDRQSRIVHSHDRWFRFDPNKKTIVYLTSLYKWYGGDFEQAAESVLNYAARYSPPLQRTLASGITPRIRWLDYDWSLNNRDNAP